METTIAETWDQRVTRERKENREKAQAIGGKLKLVAKQLGLSIVEKTGENEGFRSDTWVEAIHPDHKAIKINLHYNSYENKVTISPEYLRDYHNQYTDRSPTIGLSIEKTLGKMVADIKRRFMPDYLIYAEMIEKRMTERNDYQTKIINKMKEIRGSEPHEHERKNQTIDLSFVAPEFKGYGDIKVYSDDNSMSIQGLSQEQTLKIIEILKTI